MARDAKILAIRHRLRRRENTFRFKIVMMYLAGAPLSLAGPAILATMFWAAALLSASFISVLPATAVEWKWFFIPLTLICVPLLYRKEQRTRGFYLSEVLRDTLPGKPTGAPLIPGPMQAVTETAAVAANPRFASAGLVELFLVGPRLVLSAWQQVRLAAGLHQVDRMRAAEVLYSLCKRNSGIDTLKLLRPGEHLGGFQPVLAYLTFHRWVGVGNKWEHVWLYSSERKTLLSLTKHGDPKFAAGKQKNAGNSRDA